jgi:hypothetical protein
MSAIHLPRWNAMKPLLEPFAISLFLLLLPLMACIFYSVSSFSVRPSSIPKALSDELTISVLEIALFLSIGIGVWGLMKRWLSHFDTLFESEHYLGVCPRNITC